MSNNRVKCTSCDFMILPTAASANGGLCGPCSQGGNYIRLPTAKEQKILDERLEKLNREASLAAGWIPDTLELVSSESERNPKNVLRSKNWEHPKLGEFKFRDDRWETRIKAPAFMAFTLNHPYLGSEPDGSYELTFDYDRESDTPSDAMLAVAIKVIDRQTELIAKITQALWDDFNGLGPDVMWWHGELAEVAEQYEFSDNKAPETADDLLRCMGFLAIHIHKQVEGCKGSVAELTFYAGFEEEHGVGFLTDGELILGMGYAGDSVAYNAHP